MSDCHDRLHPADDRRNQSANATGGNAEKLTNLVMGVTARPRIQPISERFRFAGVSNELLSPPMTVQSVNCCAITCLLAARPQCCARRRTVPAGARRGP